MWFVSQTAMEVDEHGRPVGGPGSGQPGDVTGVAMDVRDPSKPHEV